MAPKVTKNLLIPLSLGIAAFLLVYIGVTFIFSLQRLEESSRKVEHSYQVIGSFRNLLLNLEDLERGLRGYLLTQNADFLAPYHSGLGKVYKEFENGIHLTSENNEQQTKLNSLRPLIDKKINLAQKMLVLGQGDQFTTAINLFKTSDAKILMEKIEFKILELEHFEFTVLSERKIKEAENSRHVIRVILISGILTLLFAALASYFIVLRKQERERFMKLILKNEQLLFQFLEAIPVGIFVLDSSGDPYYSNQAAKEILGRGVIRRIGLEHLSETYRFFQAGTGDFYPSSKMPLVQAMFGEKTRVDDIELRHDEKTIPLQVWGTPIIDEKGKVKYAIAAFIDITDRKEIEEMKDDLISIVSHQLKTPVAQINGYIENLLEGIAGEMSKKQIEYLTDMREIGLENYRLISDLLSVSKIERGVLTVEIQPMTLAKIVKLASRDYEQKIRDKGLEFKIEGLRDEIMVMADLDKSVETIRNLINNALKCTDKGGITITMKTEGLYGVIEVKDSGIGMSEEVMGRLFTKSRLMGKESSRAGAGIGLFIVKNFMKLQGSMISATSQVGKGSCFKVSIPRTGTEKGN